MIIHANMFDCWECLDSFLEHSICVHCIVTILDTSAKLNNNLNLNTHLMQQTWGIEGSGVYPIERFMFCSTHSLIPCLVESSHK